MVRHGEVDDFVTDEVAQHVGRRHHPPPVEGQIAERRTTPPAGSLITNVAAARSAAQALRNLPVVSYGMLRKALPWSWETIKRLARGQITGGAAPSRPASGSETRHGPHDLIAFADVKRILGLGTTAARNRTYDRRFPAPAYAHPHPPAIRLWRRAAVEAYAAGEHPTGGENELQALYLDAHALAARLGLARNTVTTRSSPLVPEPAVMLAGLQHWLASDSLV